MLNLAESDLLLSQCSCIPSPLVSSRIQSAASDEGAHLRYPVRDPLHLHQLGIVMSASGSLPLPHGPPASLASTAAGSDLDLAACSVLRGNPQLQRPTANLDSSAVGSDVARGSSLANHPNGRLKLRIICYIFYSGVQIRLSLLFDRPEPIHAC